jgi:arabinose-5-phosphate isomerase
LIPGNATVRDAIVVLASRRGLVMVGTTDRLEGVFTAGDLARVMQREADPFGQRISDVMTRTPQTARAEELASAVVYRMEQIGIMAMPVLNGENHVVGVVHLHDLMRAGVA